MKIAWIGAGVMGRSMAGHLLDAGHEVVVMSRTAEKATPLLERGATWSDSPAEAARGCDVVCTMVGYPSDVREVTTGPNGCLSTMESGSMLIDFTTSQPSLAAEIAEVAAAKGIEALDAPVSGGDVGAANATLTIMVGGTPDGFDRAKPVLDSLGKTIIRQGDAGAGQHTKAVNQILVAGTMLSLSEALVFARSAGLDPATVIESVGGGGAASWTLANLAPRVLNGDFEPGFYVEHFVKDLGIALECAGELGLDLPFLGLAHRLYDDLANHDGARLGTQALVLEIARQNGVVWA